MMNCEHWRWTVGQDVSCVLNRFMCHPGLTDLVHRVRKLLGSPCVLLHLPPTTTTTPLMAHVMV